MYVYLGRAEPAPRVTTETPAALTRLTRVPDTTLDPFRYVCRIQVRTSKGRSIGTGVLISRYHVLTCAHVLYDRCDPHARREVTVLPGQNGPGDTRPRIPANGWAVNPAWSWNDCMKADEDLGIIRLARPSDVGFWPIVPFDPAALTGAVAHLAGYPAWNRLDPAYDRRDEAYWMYRSGGHISDGIRINLCKDPPLAQACAPDSTPAQRQGTVDIARLPAISDTTKLIRHDLDTRHVMSGGPMWTFQDGKRFLIALHAGTVAGTAKKAVLLNNTTVRQLISDWTTRRLPPLPLGSR
jgi:Trypsin-like peptidase domain